MSEEKNLYFIPIIAKALESEEPYSAIKDALKEISELGKQPDYKEGFQQFEQFLDVGLGKLSDEPKKLAVIKNIVIERILISLATDTFEGSDETKANLLERIQSQPKLKEHYEKILSEIKDTTEEKPPIELELLKDDKLIEKQIISEETNKYCFKNIIPGHYSLRLANGRVLWEKEISSKEVIWEVAFPGKPYDMAADTDDEHDNIAKPVHLLKGELTLKLLPGLESGKIVLIFQEKNQQTNRIK